MADAFDAAFDKILKQSMSILSNSCKDAMQKGRREIIKEAKRQLEQYYANYTPTVYKRTYKLKNAIVPIFSTKVKGGSTIFEIGVRYDANKLKGFYRSNSWYHQSGTTWFGRDDPYFDWDSQNNGIPEPAWILNNFLEGKHGWVDQDTFGPQRYGHMDAEAPYNLMEEFFDKKLPNMLNKYISESLTTRLMKELNK